MLKKNTQFSLFIENELSVKGKDVFLLIVNFGTAVFFIAFGEEKCIDQKKSWVWLFFKCINDSTVETVGGGMVLSCLITKLP